MDIISKLELEKKIEKEINSGGEGKIYSLVDGKIYKKFLKPTEKTSNKLRELCKKNIINEYSCLPEVLVEDEGMIVGYVMKKIEGKSLKEILTRIGMNSDQYKREELVELALNISRGLDSLHKRNILVGDISDSNIIIDKNFNPVMIDSDSFQVGNYLCEVCTEEFTHPDLYDKDLKTYKRKIEHEEYSLGILIFKILLVGQHPFTTIQGGSLKELMIKKSFAYPSGNDYSYNSPLAPKWISTWNEFPIDIKDAFYNIFKKNLRVTISEWDRLLKDYLEGIKEKEISNEIFSRDRVVNTNVTIDVTTGLNRRTGEGKAINLINPLGNKIGILEISTKAVKLLIRGWGLEEKEFTYDDFSEKFGGYREGKLTNIGKCLDKNRNMNMIKFQNRLDRHIIEFKKKAFEMGVKNLYCVATAAIRGAKNRSEILRFLREQYNLNCRVLSREEETKITTTAFKYSGNIKDSGRKALENSFKKKYLFIDQGGGSTEIAILNGIDSEPEFGKSLNFGSTILLNTLIINNNNKTPLVKALDDNIITIKSKIRNSLRSDVKDAEIDEVIAVGTAITSATGKSGNKKQHCTVLTKEKIFQEYKKSREYLLNNFATVEELQKAIEREEELDRKERPLDGYVTRTLGLGVFHEILEKFHKDSLIVSGTGLWYGGYYHYLAEEKIAEHYMENDFAS